MPVLLAPSQAASKMARTCISVISGIGDAQPAAAMAEHRVELVQRTRPWRCSRLGAARPSPRPARAMLVLVVGQELVQRRIEQPDRHRQAVHRLEDALEVLALHRQQLGQRRSRRSARRRPGSSRAPASMRSSPKNMCSVRHRPMPSAPKAIAWRGLVGLVGVGRARSSRRYSSAQPMSLRKLRRSRTCSRHRSCPSSTWTTSEGSVSMLALDHLAGGAVDGDPVALA